MRRPWFKFWPADWAGDRKLHGCSLAARGLWIELCCLMHETEPYGHLAYAGAPMPVDRLARQVGCTRGEIAPLLKELEASGVFSRSATGTIFSRRMVRDEELAAKGREDKLSGLTPSRVPSRVPSRGPCSGPSRVAASIPSRDPSTRAEHLASKPLPSDSVHLIDDTPSLRSGVGALAPDGLPGIELTPPKGKREPSQAQVDGFVARKVWHRCWIAQFGTPYIDLKGRKSASVRTAFVRLNRDEGELERLVRAFLAAPPFKHRENPDPNAFLDSLASIAAGLNGKAHAFAGGHVTLDEKNRAALADMAEKLGAIPQREISDAS